MVLGPQVTRDACGVLRPGASIGSVRAATGRRSRRCPTKAARREAITLQFHPDWPHGSGKVIESMAAVGFYRSPFSTGISNGGLTAFPGGDRWRWESRLFDGRYDDGPGSDRPVYGAWNRRADPYGGAIRFGSSYVRLRPEAVDRSTFCFPDSVHEPVYVGDRDLLPHPMPHGRRLWIRRPRRLRRSTRPWTGALRDRRGGPRPGSLLCWHGRRRRGSTSRLQDRVPCRFPRRTERLRPRLSRGTHRRVGRVARAHADAEAHGDAARTGAHPAQSVKQVWHCLARFGRTAP